MSCPICSNTTTVEIDMHSDGYARDLVECASCGALWLESEEGQVMLNKLAA